MNRLTDALRPRFSAEDADLAYDEWGANCGPGAIAAVLGLTLNDVRPHMGDFERKHYTNPTLMWASLRSLGARFSYRGGDLGQVNWPAFGLARIQWHGPWMKEGVPARARYRHTHWVGACRRAPDEIGIFDINAIGNGSGWCHLSDWTSTIVPWIIATCVPRGDGNWSITHAVEIGRTALAQEGGRDGE